MQRHNVIAPSYGQGYITKDVSTRKILGSLLRNKLPILSKANVIATVLAVSISGFAMAYMGVL